MCEDAVRVYHRGACTNTTVKACCVLTSVPEAE